jgi:predicted RNase H-like nuclease (RuvC/YqgF family)
MQTPPLQFIQQDIILPDLTLEELHTHHQRQNFYLLAKYGTEESWRHDQVMHMQRLEQAIAQREGHAATPNTADTVEEGGPETAQASNLPTKDDSDTLETSLLHLQTAMHESTKKASELTQQVHDNSALLEELDYTMNELKNEINLMSKEMGKLDGKLLDLAKHQFKEKKGNDKRIEEFEKALRELPRVA